MAGQQGGVQPININDPILVLKSTQYDKTKNRFAILFIGCSHVGYGQEQFDEEKQYIVNQYGEEIGQTFDLLLDPIEELNNDLRTRIVNKVTEMCSFEKAFTILEIFHVGGVRSILMDALQLLLSVLSTKGEKMPIQFVTFRDNYNELLKFWKDVCISNLWDEVRYVNIPEYDTAGEYKKKRGFLQW